MVKHQRFAAVELTGRHARIVDSVNTRVADIFIEVVQFPVESDSFRDGVYGKTVIDDPWRGPVLAIVAKGIVHFPVGGQGCGDAIRVFPLHQIQGQYKVLRT
ncbi:hypothetical protein D3C79_944680 [compost metagenome]